MILLVSTDVYYFPELARSGLREKVYIASTHGYLVVEEAEFAVQGICNILHLL